MNKKTTCIATLSALLSIFLITIFTASCSEKNEQLSAKSSPIQKADFHISPSGSDTWSGTLPEPAADKSDGPFATLQRAKDAVRSLKERKKSDILVYIHGGTYQLSKTVVFNLSDSGSKDATITYAAYPGETPIFTSAQIVRNLKPFTGKLKGLPKAAQGKILVADVSNIKEDFLTLYDDQGLLPRARSAGFITEKKGNGRDHFLYPKNQFKNLARATDAEIIVRPHHAWIVNILPITSADAQTSRAQTSIEATYSMNQLHFLPETPNAWIENIIDELDQPGEWVLNTKEQKLYLWPRSQSDIFAPQLNELIRIEGEIHLEESTDTPATHIQLSGLTFKHAKRYQLAKDDAGLQHDWDMFDKDNALLRLRGTAHCTIDRCHFLHSGSGAIRVDLHGQENTLSNNHIEHIGGGGILLAGYGPGTKDVSKNNLIYNNRIHHVGEVYWHSPGIFIWQSGNNRIANNLIHDTDYTGLILSGCMTDFIAKKGRELGRTVRRHEIGKLKKGYTHEDIHPYLHSHDNIIEYNEIHNVMKKLGDGNAIYVRGAGANNIIRRNYIHHLITPMIMQCAIRTDGGQRDTLIAENLIYKCSSQGMMLKLNNRFENNIIADIISPPRGYYLSVREGPMTGATIKRNIFYSSNEVSEYISELEAKGKALNEDRRGRELARAKDADTDRNIYFSKANHQQGKDMLSKQRADGVDIHSAAVDPLFVDPDHGDFRFQPGSPAIQMGITPIDFSKIGLRDITHAE